MLDWAQNRVPVFAGCPDLDLLFNAWTFSRDTIRELRQQLEGRNLPQSCSVAISGSLSRMEAHAESDLDVLVIVDDSGDQEDDANEIFREVWRAFENAHVQLRRPKATGIFATPARLTLLTDLSVRGVVNEDVTSFGQRMQLLLDAQPICNDDAFQDVLKRLVSWYSETEITGLLGEPNCFQWFREDVLRYWHSIRSRAYWVSVTDEAQRLALNLKYRSSRLAIIAATLIAIDRCGERHSTSEQQEQLLTVMRETPCERIWSAADGPRRVEFLDAYQNIWNTVRQPTSKPSEDTLRSVEAIRSHVRDLVGL